MRSSNNPVRQRNATHSLQRTWYQSHSHVRYLRYHCLLLVHCRRQRGDLIKGAKH